MLNDPHLAPPPDDEGEDPLRGALPDDALAVLANARAAPWGRDDDELAALFAGGGPLRRAAYLVARTLRAAVRIAASPQVSQLGVLVAVLALLVWCR